jgi:hypothetical protein
MDDDSTIPYNLTFEAGKVLRLMKNIVFEKWVDSRAFQRYEGSWCDKYTIRLALIPTRYGFCTSFNIADPGQFLELEK